MKKYSIENNCESIIETTKSFITRKIIFNDNIDQLPDLILRMRGNVELSKSYITPQKYKYYKLWCLVADKVYNYRYYILGRADVSVMVEKFNHTSNLLFNLEYYNSEEDVMQKLDDIRWNRNIFSTPQKRNMV